MATSHDVSDGTTSVDRTEPRSRQSGGGRISFFGRDLPLVVALGILAFPAIGAFLGATGDASAVATTMTGFGAMVGAVGSNVQAVIAQIGTGPSIVAVSAIVLATEKIVK